MPVTNAHKDRKRGVIADEIILHKKISKSVKCFQMKRSFGCITLLRCEENRCTFLTLTKGYTPETFVYFLEGICYFLVVFVMKLSLLHLSKFKCHHSLSKVRSCFGHKYLSLSRGEQRRRESRETKPQQTRGLFLESPAVTFRVACQPRPQVELPASQTL